MNGDRLHATLRTLEHFTNDSLALKHHTQYLSGFHYNRDLLKAAVANTYVETVGNRSDSLYRAVEKSTVDAMKNSLFARMSAITKPSELDKKRCMIAFDYTTEDFYGDRDTLWIHGWTGDHGVTGRYSYLTASIVNKDLRLPVFSIPSPMGNDMPGEVSDMLQRMNSITHDIDLVLFDRGFYSKDLMLSLSGMDMPYLIFVPKNQWVKDELVSMIHGERKIVFHEFSFYRDGHKVTGDTNLAFLKQIYDHRTDEYYDWVFATNVSDMDLEKIIKQYKARWRIETMFRVQDECRIKTKSKDIRVRYFLFAYEQLIESIWYLFYHEEVSFKKFLIELSSVCSTLVENEERRRTTHS